LKVNKSLPRFSVKIDCDTRDDISSQEWPTTNGPGLSFDELLRHLLPWADFSMDEDAYDNYMEEKWMENCYCEHDSETGENYYSVSFSDYCSSHSSAEAITPISEDGETEGYRLSLELNETREGVCGR
jgi:hypothetical protein